MLKIFHKIKPFGPMSCPETSDVRLIFLLTFFLCPRNYYNDNNELCSQADNIGSKFEIKGLTNYTSSYMLILTFEIFALCGKIHSTPTDYSIRFQTKRQKDYLIGEEINCSKQAIVSENL